MWTVITNNSYVYEKFKDDLNVVYLDDGSYMEVLYKVRDKVHEGFKLLTHPLAGSIKPNQTPYRSVVLQEQKQGLDFYSLQLVENSISSAEKFLKMKALPKWNDKTLGDFKTIDLSLVSGAVANKFINKIQIY